MCLITGKVPFLMKGTSTIIVLLIAADESHANDIIFERLMDKFLSGHKVVNNSIDLFSGILEKKIFEVEYRELIERIDVIS